MTVVVVNCSPWPNFPSLIRTRALDLYPKSAGIEFWHAEAPPPDSDTQIWGGWPKYFGDPFWIMGDELEDIFSSHVSDLDRADGPIEPLVLVVVFEAGSQGRPSPAMATIEKAMNFIADRIAGSDRAAEIQRSLWRIAAICDFPGPRRVSRQTAAAEAWQLVQLHPRPTPVGQADIEAETFDTAVLIEGGLGNSDEGIFAGLRILIDMARDQRVRDVLKPGRLRTSRVIRLTIPRVGFDPADRVLIGLDTLMQDYEHSPERDEAADPLREPVRTLQSKIHASDAHLICSAAAAVVDRSRADPSVEDALGKYFDTSPPELPDLANSRDADAATNVLKLARDRLDPFLAGRNRRLSDMRRAKEWSIQEYRPLLERVEGAVVDHSLGQSGAVLTAIRTALEALEPLEDDYVGRAERCRESLNREYHVQLATARSNRRDAPALPDFAEVAQFDAAGTRLLSLFENWVSGSRFVLGWLLLTLFYVATVGFNLYFGWRGSWTWSMTLLTLSILVPTLFSALWLFLQWRWLRRRLSQAATMVQETYRAAVGHIDGVTRLALAHFAASRIAGNLKPFTRMLISRQQDLLDLRKVTERIFNIVRQDSERRLVDTGSARPPRDASLQNKLADADPQEWLKVVLSEMSASQQRDVEITASGGELTGALMVQTPLRITEPISLALVPEPASQQARPRTTPVQPASEATLAAKPETSRGTDYPEPEATGAPTARKSKRDKRPSN